MPPVFHPSAPAAPAWAAGAFFAFPQGGRTVLCGPFPAVLSGCGPMPQPGEKAEAFSLTASAQHAASPQGKANGGHGWLCRLPHPKLRGKAALCRRTGWPACHSQENLLPPARRKRAFCFAKPRLPPAGVCLPAACGHFASQSRACLRQGSACPLQAGILPRKAAPASGRGLPARCMRAFCFAKPRLPPAGVCLPAACGHFASQNRRTPYFQKINAAVYVEPPSGEKAPLHGPGQGGSSLFLICR